MRPTSLFVPFLMIIACTTAEPVPRDSVDASMASDATVTFERRPMSDATFGPSFDGGGDSEDSKDGADDGGAPDRAEDVAMREGEEVPLSDAAVERTVGMDSAPEAALDPYRRCVASPDPGPRDMTLTWVCTIDDLGWQAWCPLEDLPENRCFETVSRDRLCFGRDMFYACPTHGTDL